MKKLPKRTDDIYREIEQFKDYEYTNCIAYEMAIRSKEVELIIKELDSVLTNNMQLLLKWNDFLFDKYAIDADFLKKIYDIMDKIEVLLDQTNIDYMDYENNHNSIIKVASAFYLDYFEYFTKKETKKYGKKFLKHENNLYLGDIEGDGFRVSNKYNEELNYHEAYISQRYNRPKIKLFPKVNVNINPNLPKDELIAYISKIKDEYDKNNSIVMSPTELLGEELKAIDENLLINKKTGKYLNRIRIADMFYIYDMFKRGAKQNKIQLELSYYYPEVLEQDIMIDTATIKKYYLIAKEYIDNLK